MNDGHHLLLKRLAVIFLLLAGVFFLYYKITDLGTKGTGAPPETQRAKVLPALKITMGAGMVDKISGNEITINNFRGISGDASNNQQGVVVEVDKNTTIESLTPKDSATLKKEQVAFAEKIKKLEDSGIQISTEASLPPESVTRKKISLSDIKAGDNVIVYANEDISKLAKFTATKIEVQGRPKPTVTPPLLPPIRVQ